jgi:hypothetical protein
MNAHEPRVAGGRTRSLPSARTKAPAPAGSSAAASHQPERAPIRCETCGHTTIPALRCQCGHIVELHALAGDDTTRKACSVSTGPQATHCTCKAFTPALPESETPQ